MSDIDMNHRPKFRLISTDEEPPIDDEPDFGRELTGDDIPYHLREDARPLGQCNRCHRKTWSAAEIGTQDQMPQPDGNPCGGRIVDIHR